MVTNKLVVSPISSAYGFRNDMTEHEIVTELFKMYQKLTHSL